MFETSLTPDENMRLECLQQAVMASDPGLSPTLVIDAAEKFRKYVETGENNA